MSEGGGGSGAAGAAVGSGAALLTRSGNWSCVPHQGRSAAAMAVDRAYLYAMRLERATSFDALGIETTVAAGAGGVVRCGVYSDIAAHDFPDALAAGYDTGDIATDGATGLVQGPVAGQLASGLWWIMVVAHVAVATVRSTTSLCELPAQASQIGANPAQCYILNAVAAGALPANIAPNATQQTAPLIFLHRA